MGINVDEVEIMKIKVYYRKSLKMSEGKLASQVGHVCRELGKNNYCDQTDDVIIVLGLSDTKYKEIAKHTWKLNGDWYEQIDRGTTEVEVGTSTAFGYVDYDIQ